MHRIVQDRIEEVLAESVGENSPASAHLAECGECRAEISALRRQASMLRTLRVAEELSPRPGFYARVMERIEAQRPIDIWQLFFDSAFGRRVAITAMAMAVLFGVYLISSESVAPPVTISLEADQPGIALPKVGPPDKDAVLVDLVTYREQ